MTFKKVAIHGVGYFEAKEQGMLKKNLKKSYEKSSGPMEDIEEKMEECKKIGKKFSMPKRDKFQSLRDFTTCLSVCHNITPTV